MWAPVQHTSGLGYKARERKSSSLVSKSPLSVCLRSERVHSKLKEVSRPRRKWNRSHQNFIRWALSDSENSGIKPPDLWRALCSLKKNWFSSYQNKQLLRALVLLSSARILWLFEKRIILGSAQRDVADFSCKHKFKTMQSLEDLLFGFLQFLKLLHLISNIIRYELFLPQN